MMINGAGSTTSGAGFGGAVFGGIDSWIGPHWAIGLMLVASTMTTANLHDSNDQTTGYRFTPASFGLELSLMAQ